MARSATRSFALCALLAAAGANAGAEARKYELAAVKPAALVVQLSGKQTLTCRSQWHNVTVSSQIAGSFPVAIGELLAPAELKAPWAAPEAFVAAFGKGLFGAIRLTHDNPENYHRWRGSSPRDERLSAGGTVKAQLVAVEKTEKGERARVEVTGALELMEGGRMASRTGPNAWEARWQLPLTGHVELDLTNRTVVRVRLASKGKVTGAYTTGPGVNPDPWNVELALEMCAGALSDDVEKRLERLVAELGHDEFARREQATRDAATLEPGTLAALLARLDASDDPELRYRASLLKPKPAKSTTRRVHATRDVGDVILRQGGIEHPVEFERW